MTTSGSTPRIRLTQALYLLVLALVAASDGRVLQGRPALLAQSTGFLLVVGAVLGRLWTTLATWSLLIPAVGIGYAVQNPATPYPVFLALAVLGALRWG